MRQEKKGMDAIPNITIRTAALPYLSITQQINPLESQKTELLAYLRDIYSNEYISLAIIHAAPSLYQSAHDAITGSQNIPSARKLKKIVLATSKYVNRALSRPTPFGLFAEVGIGTFNRKDILTITQEEKIIHADADYKWLNPLIRKLEQHSSILRQLMLHRNDLIRKQHNHYILYTVNKESMCNKRVDIRCTPIIDDLLNDKDISVKTILDRLSRQFNVDEDTSLSLIKRLVNSDIFYSNLRPAHNGEERISELLEKLSHIAIQEEDKDIVEQLVEINNKLHSISGYTYPSMQSYQDTIKAMGKIQKSDAYVHFQVGNGISIGLPKSVQKDAELAIHISQILSKNRKGMSSLQYYYNEFVEQYGFDETVPILDLTDPAKGIGVPNDYKYPQYSNTTSFSANNNNIYEEHEHYLASLFYDAITKNKTEVILTDEDINKLQYEKFDKEDSQESAELYCTIASKDMSALSEGDYLLVIGPNPGSHASGSTTGRFMSLLPKYVEKQFLNPIFEPDEYSAVINYPTRSDAAENLIDTPIAGERIISVNIPEENNEHCISLSQIGIRANKEGLYAVDLYTGQKIRIRAHNTVYPPAQAPNEVRLLIEIMNEGARLWNPWSWNSLDSFPYRPRVRYGHIILSSRSWRLDELRESELASCKHWREKWNVPRYCLAVSQDMRLLLDLDNPLHQTLLINESRKDKQLLVQEIPAGGNNPDAVWGWMRKDGQSICSEIVFNFHKIDHKFSNSSTSMIPYRKIISRNNHIFLPGNENWLSCRIYMPPENMVNYLKNNLTDILDCFNSSTVKHSFFVRHADHQGTHLRIRINGNDTDFNRLTSILVKSIVDGDARTYDFNEYIPEVNRYGGIQMMELTHQCFTTDSMNALQQIDKKGMEYDLDSLAALCVMLTGFGNGYAKSKSFDLQEGKRWADYLNLSTSHDKEYQKNRKIWIESIKSVILHESKQVSKLDDLYKAYRDLGYMMKKSCNNYTATSSPTRVIGSHLHMCLNRRYGPNPEIEDRLLRIAQSVLTSINQSIKYGEF